MSYQVLARKWRPGNFEEVAGQGHVLQTLINALDSQRLHHAYLFTGTRGVGKTTLARILAKCLNCETGISSKPCGKCDSCIEISEGRFIDLMEVDAASRTKVEDTRELLENVQYTPARGRFKVYLIDEVHMLSNHSFNALLKTLEEPPPHVKFLFATTDPQKLPVTILSRCLQFSLKNLSRERISDYLQNVLENESIEFEPEGVSHIAEAAAGSMRDALTLTDQAIGYCHGSIKSASIVDMLGIPDHRKVYDLMGAVAQGNVDSVLKIVDELAEQAASFPQILDKILSLLHQIALAQVLPGSTGNEGHSASQVRELAAAMTAEDVQLYYQFGVKGRADLTQAADTRIAFEMLLIRMLVFAPHPVDRKNQEAADEAAKLEKKKNLSYPNEPMVREIVETASHSQLHSQSDRDPGTLATQSFQEPVALTKASEENEGEHSVTASSVGELSVDESDSGKKIDVCVTDKGKSGVISMGMLDHNKWLDWFDQLEVTGITANLLANCVVDKVEKNVVSFILDQQQSATFSTDQQQKMESVLSDFFATEIKVNVVVDTVAVESVAARRQRQRRERHKKMIEEFEQDPKVQGILEHFSGTLAKDSIASVKE